MLKKKKFLTQDGARYHVLPFPFRKHKNV